MALRAKKPETIEKKLKLFLFGSYKVGKTMAALNFPSVYAIDSEKGMVHDQYTRMLQEKNSEILQSNDVEEITEEIRALGTERHNFRTVLIDPITVIETDLIEKAEKKFGAGDMRIWGERDRKLKRLVNLLNNLDMNVIVTAHGKIEYGDNFVKKGTTYDGWKRWPFEFDLILELELRGSERVAVIRGSRIETFSIGEAFKWSYEEFVSRYPVIEKPVTPVILALPEHVEELKQLLDVVKLPDGTSEKWLSKAKVDCYEDMTDDTIVKCIEFVREKLPKGVVSAV